MKRLVLFGLVACLLVTAGCRRPKSEGSYEIGPDKLKSADMPPAKQITIEFESKDNVPITAVLVKTEDADAALKAVESGNKTPEQAIAAAKSIATQTGAKGTLTSPENEKKTNYSVLLHSKKSTTVTVKSNGK
jgi:hypothetical protein